MIPMLTQFLPIDDLQWSPQLSHQSTHVNARGGVGYVSQIVFDSRFVGGPAYECKLVDMLAQLQGTIEPFTDYCSNPTDIHSLATSGKGYLALQISVSPQHVLVLVS
jgi:RNase adaptor protein for sRNA GlmZ degradation